MKEKELFESKFTPRDLSKGEVAVYYEMFEEFVRVLDRRGVHHLAFLAIPFKENGDTDSELEENNLVREALSTTLSASSTVANMIDFAERYGEDQKKEIEGAMDSALPGLTDDDVAPSPFVQKGEEYEC